MTTKEMQTLAAGRDPKETSKPVLGDAVFSPCGTYRYLLSRHGLSPLRWIRPVLFILLNPSTADAYQDDPTIRRCIGFAKLWGGTRLTIVNLFALRSTDPTALVGHPDPIGPDNDLHIEEQIAYHMAFGIIVAAWGAHPLAKARGHEVVKKFGPFQCLRRTKDGAPWHPLYVPRDNALEPYTGDA